MKKRGRCCGSCCGMWRRMRINQCMRKLCVRIHHSLEEVRDVLECL
ncbi:hypothetical protein [Mediterraneibacter butyricigenes]|nr:hypothetical protein [Mediterraneibacter butyricigenes]